MKTLLLTDKPNWAYHSIAKSLVKYNPYPEIKLKVMHVKKNEKEIKRQYRKFEHILVMGWQLYDRISFLPKSITSVGIHSFHSWDEKKTTPEKSAIPSRKLVEFLSSFRSVNAVSQRLTDVFRDQGLHITYTPNGVDTDVFKPVREIPVANKMVVGYSGSKAHDWRKGVSKFILPAAKKSNVDVKLAMLSTDKYVTLDEMYKFYNEIDCYICASSSEGMSLSVLEAASCGRPIVTTRVGGCTEIIKDGVTGLFVDRKLDSIVRAIGRLKNKETLMTMGSSVRDDIVQNWCWSSRAKAWLDFLR